MLPFAPMPIVDDFLLNYNLGQIVLFLFIVSLPVGYLQGSRQITAINLALFGTIFIIIPAIDAGPSHYAFLGIALLVIGPVLFATARR